MRTRGGVSEQRRLPGRAGPQLEGLLPRLILAAFASARNTDYPVGGCLPWICSTTCGCDWGVVMIKPMVSLVSFYLFLHPLSVFADDRQPDRQDRPALSDLVGEWGAGIRTPWGTINTWNGGGCGQEKTRPCPPSSPNGVPAPRQSGVGITSQVR